MRLSTGRTKINPLQRIKEISLRMSQGLWVKDVRQSTAYVMD
jgi:hypothetical protein